MKDIRKPLVGPFTIVDENGKSIVVDTLEEVRAITGDLLKEYPQYTEFKYDYKNKKYIIKECVSKWICRDLFGQYVIPGDFPPKDYCHNHIWLKQKKRAIELGIAIPHTGRHRGGRCYRAIKTQQEIRENSLAYDDETFYNIKVRRRYLPNSWDDIGFSEYRPKNWKKYRNYQWKN